MWTDQLDQAVSLGSLSIALSISGEVSEISDVTGLVGWGTVGLSVWVDCMPLPVSAVCSRLPLPSHIYDAGTSEYQQSRRKVATRTMRTGRSASIGVVSKLMDVEASLGVGIVASEVPGDGGGRGLGLLLKDNGS